jgi:hypothetical protein
MNGAALCIALALIAAAVGMASAWHFAGGLGQ